MSVTLVRTPSKAAPEKADFLAQENQLGSGTAEKKAIPRAEPPPRETPPARPTERPPAPVPEPMREARRKPVLVKEKSEKKIVADEGEDEQPKPNLPKFSADLLSQQISEVSTALTESHDTEARHPKIVYINSVNAHKYKAAAYEQAWQQKIERIGNLNYPDEARRQKLSGALVLAVGVRQDGSIYSVQVRQPSEHKVLDEAAERIVRLAAPFAPFPDELKQEADVLVITRTWRFYNNYRLETR